MQSGNLSDYQLSNLLLAELNLIFHDLETVVPIIEKIDIKALQDAKMELRSSLLSAAAQSNEAWRTHTSVDLKNLKSIIEKHEEITQADVALSKLRQLNGTLLMIEAIRARKNLSKEVQDLCNVLSHRMQILFQQRLDIHKYITEEEQINATLMQSTIAMPIQQKDINTKVQEKPVINVSEEQKEKGKDVSGDVRKQVYSIAIPHQSNVYKPEDIVHRLAKTTRNTQRYVNRQILHVFTPQVAAITEANKRKADVSLDSDTDIDPRKKSKQNEASEDIQSNFGISQQGAYSNPASTPQTSSLDHASLAPTLFHHSPPVPVQNLPLLEETQDSQDDLENLVSSILADPTLLSSEADSITRPST